MRRIESAQKAGGRDAWMSIRRGVRRTYENLQSPRFSGRELRISLSASYLPFSERGKRQHIRESINQVSYE